MGPVCYECDCCGNLAAEEGSIVHDGQPLMCGCNGHWSVDAECAYVAIPDCDPCTNPDCGNFDPEEG